MERRDDVKDLGDMSYIAAMRRVADSARRKQTGRRSFKFEIGKLATSEKVLDKMEESWSFADFCWSSFSHHCLCDWAAGGIRQTRIGSCDGAGFTNRLGGLTIGGR